MTTTEANIDTPEPPKIGESRGARRIDPVLRELWEVKARINAEAEYSVENIFERARRSAAEHSTDNEK